MEQAYLVEMINLTFEESIKNKLYQKTAFLISASWLYDNFLIVCYV